MKIPIKRPGSKIDMSKSNGQADIRIEEKPEQTTETREPELPPAEGDPSLAPGVPGLGVLPPGVGMFSPY